jgi:hypothetical protein
VSRRSCLKKLARARISGTGMLWLQGLVPENILDPIASVLSETVGSGSSPTALLALIEAIAAQSGLKEVLQERRWIGTVDWFWRSEPDSVLPGPLLNAVPEKPDFRTRNPSARKRHGSCLHASHHDRNFDEVLKDYVVPMAGPRISQIKARRVARHRLAQRYASNVACRRGSSHRNLSALSSLFDYLCERNVIGQPGRRREAIRHQHRWRKGGQKANKTHGFRTGEVARFVHCSVTSGHNEFFTAQLKPFEILAISWCCRSGLN